MKRRKKGATGRNSIQFNIIKALRHPVYRPITSLYWEKDKKKKDYTNWEEYKVSGSTNKTGLDNQSTTGISEGKKF